MTSFRPRAIDIDKPLNIIREELNDEETRSMPVLSTGMEINEENEAHIREAIAEAQRKSRKIIANIPTPIVKQVPSYDEDTELWNQPISYIKVTPPVESLFIDPLQKEIEYDIDSDDEIWISSEINKNGIQLLSHYDFELLFNIFEKTQAHKNLFKTKKQDYDKLISLEEAIISVKELKRIFPLPLLEKVYNYWIEKRKKYKRPLLLSTIPPPAFNNPSPLVAFRPRENERKKVRKSNHVILEHLKILREELVKGKEILDKIKHRESLKKKYLTTSHNLFELKVLEKDKKILKLKSKASSHKNSKLFSFESSSDEYSDDDMNDFNFKDTIIPKKITPRKKKEPKIEHIVPEHSYEPHNEWDKFPSHYHNEENNPSDKEKYWGTIKLPDVIPFRGRVRMGRGGRIFIDRGSSRIKKTDSKPNRISLY